METVKVRDCMTTQPAIVTADMSIISALRIILDKKHSAAVVTDENGKLIGLLSEADCIEGTFGRGFYEQDGMFVSDRMSTDIETISSENSVISSVDRFLKNHRRLLPVVEGQKLVGILTRENLLRALLHEIDNPTQHARRP